MAQSTLHLSFGMLLGTLFSLPPFWRAWQRGLPVARTVLRWILLSYALGIYAVLPAIVRRFSSNPDIGSSIGWNVFLFFPLVDRLPLPSILVGELAVGSIFALQYAVMLLAIRRTQHRFADAKRELDI